METYADVTRRITATIVREVEEHHLVAALRATWDLLGHLTQWLEWREIPGTPKE
jgi:hypothetical protein